LPDLPNAECGVKPKLSAGGKKKEKKMRKKCEKAYKKYFDSIVDV